MDESVAYFEKLINLEFNEWNSGMLKPLKNCLFGICNILKGQTRIINSYAAQNTISLTADNTNPFLNSQMSYKPKESTISNTQSILQVTKKRLDNPISIKQGYPQDNQIEQANTSNISNFSFILQRIEDLELKMKSLVSKSDYNDLAGYVNSKVILKLDNYRLSMR